MESKHRCVSVCALMLSLVVVEMLGGEAVNRLICRFNEGILEYIYSVNTHTQTHILYIQCYIQCTFLCINIPRLFILCCLSHFPPLPEPLLPSSLLFILDK